MAAIRLSAVVGEDRQVTLKLPDDTPLGPVELLVWSTQAVEPSMREILQAAGILAVHDDSDDDFENVSDEELEELGKLPPGAPSPEKLIDEDRGPR